MAGPRCVVDLGSGTGLSTSFWSEHGDVAMSEGSLRTLLEAGVTEEAVGLDRLREAEIRTPVRWWISYRVWVGLK